MSSSIESLGPREGWVKPPPMPLDEAIWQTWLMKGCAQDLRSDAARGKVVKWVSVTGLLAAAGLWSERNPYEVAARLVLAAGSMLLMVRAFNTRHFAIAALLCVLVLLFNPAAPAFSFSDDWQRVVAVASAIPLVAALAWRHATTEPE